MSKQSKSPKGSVMLGFDAPAADAAVAARDLEAAMNRIGGADERLRAKWLIETFLYEDPDVLSTGSLMNRRWEMVAFLALSMFEASPTVNELGIRLGAQGELTEPGALRAAWQEIGARIHQWADDKPVTLPLVSVTAQRRNDVGKDLRARIVRTPDGGFADKVLIAAFDLLAHPDVRVRRCKECKRFFIPVRRQERHEKCARKVRDAKRPERGSKPKKGAK